MATAEKIEEAYKLIHDAEKKLLLETRDELVKLRDAMRERKLPKLLEKLPPPRGSAARSAAHSLVVGFDNTIAGWPGYLDGQITQLDVVLSGYDDPNMADGTGEAPRPIPTS